MPPIAASETVTAGLKCPPEIGPKVRMSATSAPPVAMAFARSASPTFPPDRRSPMTPDPMTVARSSAVPIPSETTLLASCAPAIDSPEGRRRNPRRGQLRFAARAVAVLGAGRLLPVRRALPGREEGLPRHSRGVAHPRFLGLRVAAGGRALVEERPARVPELLGHLA